MKTHALISLLALVSTILSGQNNVLVLNGAQDFRECVSDEMLSPFQSFTIETWARFNSNRTGDIDFIAEVGNNSTTKLWMWYNNGSAYSLANKKLVLGYSFARGGENNESNFLYDFDPNPNTWYHLAYTYDHLTRKINLYINGESRGAKDVTGSQPSSTLSNVRLVIGKQIRGFASNHFFNGQLDEFRLWGSNRTASEIANNFRRGLSGQEPGLLAYYKFNEPLNNVFADCSKNGLDLSLGSSQNPVSSTMQGFQNTACGFSNADNSLLGKWVGYLEQDGSRTWDFELEVLQATGNNVTGVTIISEQGNRNATGHLTFEAMINGDNFQFIEKEVLYSRVYSRWCFKTGNLKLIRSNSSSFLDGRWVAPDCNPGRIFVRKLKPEELAPDPEFLQYANAIKQNIFSDNFDDNRNNWPLKAEGRNAEISNGLLKFDNSFYRSLSKKIDFDQTRDYELEIRSRLTLVNPDGVSTALSDDQEQNWAYWGNSRLSFFWDTYSGGLSFPKRKDLYKQIINHGFQTFTFRKIGEKQFIFVNGKFLGDFNRNNFKFNTLHFYIDDGPYGEFAGEIDYIKFYYINQNYENDLAVTQLISPSKGCQLGKNQRVTVKINNYGTRAQSNFNIQYQVNNSQIIQQNVGNQIVPAGGSIEFSFNTTYDFNASGNYTFRVGTQLANDQNKANDELSLQVENLPAYNATWRGQSTICEKQTVDIFVNQGTKFLWSNGSTNQRLFDNINSSKTYTVTVTGDFPTCVDVDTITVTVIPLPQTPTIQASNPDLNFCEGQSITLTPNISSNIRWTNGFRSSSITLASTTTIGVQQLGPNGCNSPINYITVRMLPLPDINSRGNGTICTGNSETLWVTNGTSFRWSNGATTSSIMVTPTSTTTYSVTVSNAAKCSYELSKTIFLAPNVIPGAAQNLLPINGFNRVAMPVQLSWTPGINATLYDVFIWRDGQTEPLSPQYRDLSTLGISISNLTPGTTYRWKVRSRNCNEGPFSVTQSFFTLPNSDLRPQAVVGPSQAVFSGSNLSVRWETRNISTTATPAQIRWNDAVYLSNDGSVSNDDYYLGAVPSLSTLGTNQTYSNSLNATLPEGIEGEYFILVIADGFNAVAESNESNNLALSQSRVVVRLTPPSDLKVTNIIPPGVAGNIFSGTTGKVSWTVKNQGLGNTRSKSWEDRVYFSTDPNPNNRNWKLLASEFFQGELVVNATYQRTVDVEMPKSFGDTIYIIVSTDFRNQEYEHFFEDNNVSFSSPVRVILTPQPDLIVQNPTFSAIVSNGQNINVQWTGQNLGANMNQQSIDAIYLSSSGNSLSNAIKLGEFNRRGLLNTSISYSGSASINIPRNISGNYFLVVVADENRQVIEANENNNLVSRAILIQAANLQASDVSNPSQAIAGQNINVTWKVNNAGSGALLNQNLFDAISLSTSPTGANPIQIGSISGSSTLLTNNSMNRQRSVTLPLNLMAGTYYVLVNTNADSRVHEAGRLSDNLSISKQVITITEASFPDLVASSIGVTGNLQIGATLEINYRVRNNGNTMAIGEWSDQVYLSSSASFSPTNAISLASKVRSKQVPVGQSYLDSVSIIVPSRLVTGNYYLHFVTDAKNQLFENTGENNNLVSSGPYTIQVNNSTFSNINLRNVIAPNSVSPGESSTLTWTVLNTGNGPTNSSIWEDRLYLSTDSLLSLNNDILVSRWSNNNKLEAGESYSRKERFSLPNNIRGTFFLIIVSDPENTNRDARFDDNATIIKIGANQNGNSGNTTIVFPAAADLEMIAIATPSQVQAGQPFRIRYTVRNNGPGIVKVNWGDLFVLSEDLVLGSDFSLGQTNKKIELKANVTYSDSLQVFAPINAKGNYLVLGFTDYNNRVAESTKTNNLASTFIVVQQPLPADLKVTAISSTPEVRIGKILNVNWRLQNRGINPIAGFMRELVYLSLDTIWDANDQLLGALEGNIALPGNGEITRTLNARPENVSHLGYHLIVRTDVLNNLVEENEDNNTEFSNAKVKITIPELPIGKAIVDTLFAEKPLYYRIESSIALKNETLLLNLKSMNKQAINELYLRRNLVPNRTIFDFAFDQAFKADQQILVPILQDSTYYMMAFQVQPLGTNQIVTLLAEIVEFNINTVNANKGGNTGNVTIQLKGTKFEDGMQIWLEDKTLGMIRSSALKVKNSVEAFATFNLKGAKIGKYDVFGKNIFGDTVRLKEAFEVVQSSSSTNSLQVTCSVGDGSNTYLLDTDDPLAFEAIHPSSARPNQVIPITLRFENAGNVDVPIPKRFLSSLNGAPLGLSNSDVQKDTQELKLEFSETDGPTNALRPGAVVIRTVYTLANQNLTILQFNLN